MFVCAQTSAIWFVETDGSLGKAWLCPWKEQRTHSILGRDICQSIKFSYQSVCKYSMCAMSVCAHISRGYKARVCVHGWDFSDHECHCVMTEMCFHIFVTLDGEQTETRKLQLWFGRCIWTCGKSLKWWKQRCCRCDKLRTHKIKFEMHWILHTVDSNSLPS